MKPSIWTVVPTINDIHYINRGNLPLVTRKVWVHVCSSRDSSPTPVVRKVSVVQESVFPSNGSVFSLRFDRVSTSSSPSFSSSSSSETLQGSQLSGFLRGSFFIYVLKLDETDQRHDFGEGWGFTPTNFNPNQEQRITGTSRFSCYFLGSYGDEGTFSILKPLTYVPFNLLRSFFGLEMSQRSLRFVSPKHSGG